MEISKKYVLLLFFILVAYAVAINEWNIHAIKKNNPFNALSSNRSLVYNSSVFSIDNDWYTSQIKNYLNGKGFTIDPERYNYNVRRTPVYPLFYGLHFVLFGETKSYFFIRGSQILIYALSVIALFFAVLNFTIK